MPNIWGSGPFDNNEAMALCNTMADHPEPVAYLRGILTQAAMDSGSLKAGCRTVAAAKLLALDMGLGEAGPPGECKPPLWAISLEEAQALRPLAAQALAAVLSEASELRRRWDQTGAEGETWRVGVEDLQHHLA